MVGLDGELRNMIQGSRVWREKEELLRTVTGVGEQASMALVAELSELGALSRKQIALWWVWRLSTATAVPQRKTAPPGVAGPESVPLCT